MWHASAAGADRERLRAVALAALEGVGSELLGQWEEWTGKAFHIRRRISPAEQEHVGPVLDIRGTDQARWRRSKVAPHLPRHLRALEE